MVTIKHINMIFAILCTISLILSIFFLWNTKANKGKMSLEDLREQTGMAKMNVAYTFIFLLLRLLTDLSIKGKI